MAGRQIYRNATIVAGEELEPLEDGFIVVEGRSIAEIGQKRVLREGINLHGCVVIPGFVDGHIHLGDAVCKEAGVGLPTIDVVSPPKGLKYRILKELSHEQLREALGRAVDELLMAGITAFGDFREGGKYGAAALREALKEKPAGGVVFGEPEWTERGVKAPHYLENVEALLEYAEGVGIGDVADFSPALLLKLRKMTSSRGKRIAVHAAETEAAQKRCVRIWGKTEIARVVETGADLLIHVTNPTPEDLTLIAEKQVPVVCCVRTNCILVDGIPPLTKLFRSGVPVALGTDNMMITSPDMFREMDFASRLARVESGKAEAITAVEVLKAATIGGARALGIADEVGSLEPGKAASFIALDFNTANLQGVHDLYSAVVHRASQSDVVKVLSYGEEVR